MSRHRSFGRSNAGGKKRNVMKRFERIELLQRMGKWKKGDRVTGLPKTTQPA